MQVPSLLLQGGIYHHAKYQVVKVSSGGLPPPHSLSIPGSLEPSWGLRKPPACSPSPLSIPETSLGPQEAPSSLPLLPGSLKTYWGLRKPPVCSPCSQLAPSLPLPPEHPWSLRKPPACSPHSPLFLSIPASLEAPWGLRKPQLTPLAPSSLSSLPMDQVEV